MDYSKDSTFIIISPFFVNLLELLTRFNRTCRILLGSEWII